MLSKNSKIYFLLGLILIVHILILNGLMFFPYPELFVYPYLTNKGLLPYKDILDQHFPGLMFLPINFDSLGMNNEEIARIWSVVVVVLIQILLFAISYKIFKSKKKALLVNFLYLIWQPFFEGWVLWIDSFLPLFLLPAFYAFIKKRFFLTGLLLGVGVVFKQTLIPLPLFVLVYLFWQDRQIKSVVRFLFGLMIPTAGMLLYIISIGVLKDFWYWTVIFNLTVFARFGTSLPSSVGFVTRPILVYGASLLLFFYPDKKMVGALFIFLLGSLLGIFDRANFVHFQPSLPFALLATVAGIDVAKRYMIVKLITLVYLAVATWWVSIFYKGHISSKVFFFDEQTKVIASKIKQYTKADEKIFIFGAVPHLYQMSNTLPAGNIFVFQFPWFLKVAEDRILNGIIKDKPNIIISDRSVKIEDQKITDFAKKLDHYIQEFYEKIDNVGDTEILKRK